MEISNIQIILLASIGFLAVMYVVIYNRLVELRNKVREAFSTMDVFLKKRYDIIPNLVVVVKGYASHEAAVLEETTSVRVDNGDLGSTFERERQITDALSKVMLAVESYPVLKADKNFLDLQQQLVKIEEDIASARRYYNGSVREYNNRCETIPHNIVAHISGFKSVPMFKASAEEREAREVDI